MTGQVPTGAPNFVMICALDVGNQGVGCTKKCSHGLIRQVLAMDTELLRMRIHKLSQILFFFPAQK